MPACWYFPGRLGHRWVCQRPWSISVTSTSSSRVLGRTGHAHRLAPGLLPDRSAALMLGWVAVCRHESRLLGELLSAACAALFKAASHICSSCPLPAALTEQSPGPCCPLHPCPTSRHPSRSPLPWMMHSGVSAHLCKRREGRSSWDFAWHIVGTPSCVLPEKKGREALLSRCVRTGGS